MEDIIRPVEHDYNMVRVALYAISNNYPFTKLESIGKSVLGRDIPALRIGGGSNTILYAAAFHGMERLTTLIVLRFAEHLCRAVSLGSKIAGIDVHKTLAAKSLVIVPVVNPDGCEIALSGATGCGRWAAKIHNLCKGDFSIWNANARGVDINHNFNAGWKILQEMEADAGIYGPAPTRYGGPRPESEPETAALVEFCREHKPSHVLAWHSQGEEIYWHYGSRTPKRSANMAKILANSSGYSLEAPIGLASHGGFKDWFIEEFGRPGFTIEIGKGKNPLDSALLDPIYNQLEEMMMLCCVI